MARKRSARRNDDAEEHVRKRYLELAHHLADRTRDESGERRVGWQTHVAAQLGITQSYLSQLLSGRKKRIGAIARAWVLRSPGSPFASPERASAYFAEDDPPENYLGEPTPRFVHSRGVIGLHEAAHRILASLADGSAASAHDFLDLAVLAVGLREIVETADTVLFAAGIVPQPPTPIVPRELKLSPEELALVQQRGMQLVQMIDSHNRR